MSLRNSRHRWGGIAQLFHWSIALAVVGLAVLGWIMVYWPLGPTQFRLYELHKSVGVALLALTALRLLWRLVDPPPPLPVHMPSWERTAAHITHVALYLSLIALPVSGYVINSATNFPLSVFGLFTLPNVTGEDPVLQKAAEWVHLSLFWVLGAAFLLHVGGALRHHFVARDDVLRRMLPGRQGESGGQ